MKKARARKVDVSRTAKSEATTTAVDDAIRESIAAAVEEYRRQIDVVRSRHGRRARRSTLHHLN